MKSRVCVITGGALGIGRCLVEEFIKTGALVAFIDMDREAGQELAKHTGAYFYHGDIADPAVLEAFAEEIRKRYTGVDCLIHNACVSRGGILTPCSYEDFNYVLRVGVSAPYYLTQLLLPLFTKEGSIVNITSTRAYMSQADTESYTAAKGGISALTHGLAVSLAGRVRVNSIAPGWIDTGAYHDPEYIPLYSEADEKQHPSGRVGDPMDIARVVLFLCDPRNSFINGENITVDGGMTKLMIYTEDQGWSYTVNK